MMEIEHYVEPRGTINAFERTVPQT
jgi:hypothetical protein